MAGKTLPILTREQAVKAFEDAFEKPVDFDHKPTADEIFALQVLAVAQAQLEADQAAIERVIEFVKGLFVSKGEYMFLAQSERDTYRKILAFESKLLGKGDEGDGR